MLQTSKLETMNDDCHHAAEIAVSDSSVSLKLIGEPLILFLQLSDIIKN